MEIMYPEQPRFSLIRNVFVAGRAALCVKWAMGVILAVLLVAFPADVSAAWPDDTSYAHWPFETTVDGNVWIAPGGYVIVQGIAVGSWNHYSDSASMEIFSGSGMQSASTWIGYDSSMVGRISVSGPGSWFTASIETFDLFPGTKTTPGLGVYVGAGGKGQLDILDGATMGTVRSSSPAYTISMPVNLGTLATGVGVMNVSGVASTGQRTSALAYTLIVGDAGRGTLNVNDGALLKSTATATIGNKATGVGTATITGTGTLWKTQSLNVGGGGFGLLNIHDSAGVQSDGASTVGTTASGSGYVDVYGKGSFWAINQSLTVGSAGTGRVFIHEDAELSGSGTVIVGGAAGSRGWLDVENARITAHNMEGSAAQTGKFNILGSGSTISLTGDYNRGQNLGTYFYVDSTVEGTTAIHVQGDVDLTGTTYFAAYGMAVQDPNRRFDLYQAGGSITGELTAPEMKVVSAPGDKTVTVAFDDSAYPVWDISTQPYFFPDADREYMGWVKVTGEPINANIHAYFTYNGNRLKESVYEAFVAYINHGLSASGYAAEVFGRSDNGVDFTIPVDLFADASFQMLGWGLDYFNDLHGSNISLQYLYHAPEPATWILLLLGGAAVAVLRKTRNDRIEGEKTR